MITSESAKRFLEQPRITVVGATDRRGGFGGTLYKELKARGYEVTPVNPSTNMVDGDVCSPDLASVPGSPGAVLVVVNAAQAVDVVRQCVAQEVRHVWLFKGLGARGAVSDEAVRLCQDNGIDVVAGACPLMFLDPVGLPHQVHRGLRRLRGTLVAS